MSTPLVASSPAKIANFQDRSGYFIASLEIEMFRAARYERPLSVVAVVVEPWDARSAEADDLPHRRLYLDRRLRQAAPSILRMPDFWGRAESGPFLLVLPETPLDGAVAVATRLSETRPFQAMVTQDNGRSRILLGAAAFSDATPTIVALIDAARDRPVWRPEAARAEA